jgi:hypothetical protein
MRNYWIKIGLGALVIFIVGMTGVTLYRRGVVKVNSVLEGSGPLSFPLPFVPFNLDGNKLGTLERVTLHRDAPRHINSVELEVNLPDSLTAAGLQACRLAANFDEDVNRRGVQVRRGPFPHGMFTCIQGDSVPSGYQEFGHAILHPADLRIPLLLPQAVVDDLQKPGFGDSAEATADRADSIAEAASNRADSIAAAAERMADSISEHGNRLGDSLRAEGQRRADSARAAARRLADSLSKH